jgi:hypothetical protein
MSTKKFRFRKKICARGRIFPIMISDDLNSSMNEKRIERDNGAIVLRTFFQIDTVRNCARAIARQVSFSGDCLVEPNEEMSVELDGGSKRIRWA